MQYYCPKCKDMFDLKEMTEVNDLYWCGSCKPADAPEKPKPVSRSGKKRKAT